MMDSPTASEPSSAVPNPSRFWERVFRGVGVFLLCYVAVAYLIVPQIWKTYARHRPSFDDNPRLTKTRDGHPGDALNVALTGTESELKAIMSAAKWYPADPLGLRSDLRIGVDTVLERSYDAAPVSNLYLYGRHEDLAFEQPVGDDPRHRHHVRFWRSDNADQERPIWVGAATYDERVGLSHTTGQITHHTAPDIDTERGHFFATLQRTEGLAETYRVPGFHQQLEGKNGGGDRWYTDGALWVGVIKESFMVPKQAFDDLDAGRIERIECQMLTGVPRGQRLGTGYPKACKANDGSLWIVGRFETVKIPHGAPYLNPLPPAVHIENLRIDGNSHSQTERVEFTAGGRWRAGIKRISR